MMKLIPHFVSTVLLVVLVRYSCGSLQEITVSQGTFGGELGRLITEKVDTLLSQKGALEPEINSCVSEVKVQTDKCIDCLGTISCQAQSVNLALVFLGALDPSKYFPDVAEGVKNLANSIASGAQAIFDNYGVDAINAIKDGFASIKTKFGSLIGTEFTNALDQLTSGLNTIADTAKDVANTALNIFGKGLGIFGSSFKNAFTNTGNTIVNTGKSAVKKIKNFFGKRRRRSSMSDIEIPELTDEQRQCMSQCPDCVAFAAVVSPETAIHTITGHICGSQLADTLQTLQTAVENLMKLVDDMKANVKLLSKLWINTSTNTVSSFEGWKNGTYFVYHPDVTITWNMFNDMPMYRAIAEYLLDHY